VLKVYTSGAYRAKSSQTAVQENGGRGDHRRLGMWATKRSTNERGNLLGEEGWKAAKGNRSQGFALKKPSKDPPVLRRGRAVRKRIQRKNQEGEGV